MKKTGPRQLKVTYELVPPDPANEKNVGQELERGFDVLFDIVLSEMAEQNKVLSIRKPKLDNSVWLGIE